MKGRGRQTLSITLRTDAHAATNRVSHPDTRPITPQFTPPLFTFINTHIITPYVTCGATDVAYLFIIKTKRL